MSGETGAPERPLVVDVFFAIHSEDQEIVRKDLRAATTLTYSHPLDVRLHVLDAGRRPAMAAVAAEKGANHITPHDNIGFKAGVA